MSRLSGCPTSAPFALDRPVQTGLILALLALVALPTAGCQWPRLARKNGREQAEELARQARRAADRGDDSSARYLLAAAVESNPHDCETRLELSEMLLEHGSLPAAVEHLKQVVKENPDDPRGYVRLAQSLYLQDDVEAAESHLEEALERDSSNPQAWLLKARILAMKKRDADALVACYQSLSISPDLAAARLLAAELHLREGNPSQATPLLRSLLEREDACEVERTDATWLLGLCYAREERWNDAAHALRSVIGHRGDSAADWYQLAYASYRAGDSAGSEWAVAKALEIAPAHREARTLRKTLETRVAKAVYENGAEGSAGTVVPAH